MKETVSRPVYTRRWFIVLVVAMVLGAVVLVALPYGLSYGLNAWLRQNGGDDVTIQDVDFNVFTGRVAIENLQLTANQRALLDIPRLDLDVDWLPLFSRQVVVRSVAIYGVAIEIEQAADGSIRVGGINPPAGGTAEAVEPGKTWHVGVDSLAIVDTTINYRMPGLQLDTRLDDLRLTGIKTWANEPAPIVFKGTINMAAVHLDGQLPPLSSGLGYRGRVTVDGLDLAGFASLAEGAVSGLAGRVSVDSSLDILQADGGPLTVAQSGTVSTSSLAFRQAANQLAVGDLSWRGDVEVGAGDTLQVTANGKVSAAAVDFDMEGADVRLAHVDAIDIGNVALKDTGDVTVSALAIGGVVLAKAEGTDAAAIATAAGLDLDTVQLSQGNVSLGTLVVRDLLADLQRNTDGEWQVTQLVNNLSGGDEVTKTDDDSAPDMKTAAAAEQAPTATRIESISITGDSAVTLQDASVKPAFKTRLVITAADIGRIDSASPATDTPVTLKARTGKHSRINVKGTVRPFAERPTLSLENHLEGIALTEVSPYTISALGYALKSGHLDADSTVKADNGKLDINNKLTIRALEVTPVDNASREKLDQQMSVPLDTALNMLRDKHDTIKLELPVNGDIDSPDFDVSDVINTAVSKALKEGAKTYLLLALQPYGALVSVAQMAGEAASRVRLDPVGFDAGAGVRRADSGDYLAKVAGILKDRPEINIKVCGLSSELDRVALSGPGAVPSTAGGRLPDTILEPEATAGKPPADVAPPPAAVVTDERLLELAAERAATVTDFLVTTHGITASRLVTCQPEIDKEANAQGRVELLI